MRIGRPVKWICERSEAFIADDHARDNVSEAELALDEDGAILALRVSTNANLGASPVRAFWTVFFPLSMPGVSAGILLVFITAAGFYVTPALLGGDRNAMIAVLIEQHVTRTLNWPLASALASLLLVISVCLYLVYERVCRRTGGLGVLR